MKRISISLLALLALPLGAQDTGFSAGGAIIVAPKTYFGGYDKAVNNNLGYFVSGAYTLKDALSEEVSARVSLGYGLMPGKTRSNHTTYQRTATWMQNPNPGVGQPEWVPDQVETRDIRSNLKTSLSVIQIAGDLVIRTSIPSLRGIVGVSVNTYSAKYEGSEMVNHQVYNAARPGSDLPPTVAVDFNTLPEHHFPVKDTGGIKGGFRLGFEYSVSKKLSAELLFQQTELAGQNTADPIQRAGGINPAWLQLGVQYHF